jgi:hypothetical protein
MFGTFENIRKYKEKRGYTKICKEKSGCYSFATATSRKISEKPIKPMILWSGQALTTPFLKEP